jgi:hypothetical protein
LLKGLKLPRVVGDQPIRITSLGRTQRENIHEDQYGRRWQVSRWPLGYADTYVICYALPVPEGYVGMVQLVGSSQLDLVDEYMHLLANAVYVNYSGTMLQWQAFLGRRALRPAVFDRVKLEFDDTHGVSYESPRLAVQLPANLVESSADSELVLHMTYMLAGDKLAWDVGGLYLYKDDSHHTYVGLERHVKPAEDSGKDLVETWKQMSVRGPGFNRVAGHDDEFRNYWIHDAVSASSANIAGIDPGVSVLYDVFYGTDASAYPRDLEDTERRLVQATRILER